MKRLLYALLRIIAAITGRGCGGACTPVLVFILALFCGCVSQERVVDGTQTRIGILVPLESQVYGFNLLSYTAGVMAETQTNMPMRVKREYCSSNVYFGVISTAESSKTEVEVKP